MRAVRLGLCEPVMVPLEEGHGFMNRLPIGRRPLGHRDGQAAAGECRQTLGERREHGAGQGVVRRQEVRERQLPALPRTPHPSATDSPAATMPEVRGACVRMSPCR